MIGNKVSPESLRRAAGQINPPSVELLFYPRMEHSSTPLSALWKEAIESFTTEADLSEQETASLGLFHSPEQLLDVVGYGHSGRSRGLVRQRLKAQKTVTAVLNIFGALDLALNLAQGVLTLFISVLIKRHSPRCASFPGLLSCFSKY